MPSKVDTGHAHSLPGTHSDALLPRTGDLTSGIHLPFLVFWAVFAWIFYLTDRISPAYFGIGVDNFWFDGDIPRYVCQSVDALANDHWRNKVHPLFSLLVWPLPGFLHELGGDLILAMRVQIALVCATGMLFLYLGVRALGMPVVLAVMLVAIASTSASVMAWFTVAESYPYTFAALTLMFYMLARSTTQPSLTWHWAAGIGLAFAVTISNIALAILIAIQAIKPRRVVWAVLLAVAMVAVLAVAQRLVFPSSGIFFLPTALQGESEFMRELTPARVREVLTIVLGGSFIFPQVREVASGSERALTVQHASMQFDAIPTLGLILLGILYVQGFYLLARRLKGAVRTISSGDGPSLREPAALLAVPVLGGLAFLLALHSVYGKETFLYSGSFLPLLMMVICVALGASWVRRYRLAIPILACLLAVNVLHNTAAFERAVTQLHDAARKPLTQKMLDRNTCAFVKRNLLD